MDVLYAIRKRRSVRFYTGEPITEDKIKKLVEAAIWAPSGHRMYARRIVIAQQEEVIRQIKAVSPGLHSNPTTLMILCRDEKKERETIDNWVTVGKEQAEFFKTAPEGYIEYLVKVLAIMDIAIAAQNICLAATSLEIGSCMIGMFDTDAVRKLLDLPDSIVPQLFVSLGYQDKTADVRFLRSARKMPMRRSVEETVIRWIR